MTILTLQRNVALKMKSMMLQRTKILTAMLRTTTFYMVDEVQVYIKLKEINPSGPDGISPKHVRLGTSVLAHITTNVINYGIITFNFPSNLKMANGSAVYNYRPVIVLPTISKLFESILADQV